MSDRGNDDLWRPTGPDDPTPTGSEVPPISEQTDPGDATAMMSSGPTGPADPGATSVVPPVPPVPPSGPHGPGGPYGGAPGGPGGGAGGPGDPDDPFADDTPVPWY